jgi:hypothetical protein
MGIFKTAKNLTVTIENKHTVTAKIIEETAEKVTIVATHGDLNLISNHCCPIKKIGMLIFLYIYTLNKVLACLDLFFLTVL